MVAVPERMLAAVREARVSAAYLRESLEKADAIWAEMEADLQEPQDIPEVVRKYAEGARRCGVSAQLEEFGADRAALRYITIELCVEAGMALTEYAEITGISRQQAQRLAQRGGGSK